jgi:hypothetical protein
MKGLGFRLAPVGLVALAAALTQQEPPKRGDPVVPASLPNSRGAARRVDWAGLAWLIHDGFRPEAENS